MTPFMQAWEDAEHARHRSLLHQLKRELAQFRSHSQPTPPAPPVPKATPVAVPVAPIAEASPRPSRTDVNKTEKGRILLKNVLIQ